MQPKPSGSRGDKLIAFTQGQEASAPPHHGVLRCVVVVVVVVVHILAIGYKN